MLTFNRFETAPPDPARKPIGLFHPEATGAGPLTTDSLQHALARLPPAGTPSHNDDYSAANPTATAASPTSARAEAPAELRIRRRWLTRQLRLIDEHAPHGLLARLETVRLLRLLLRLRYQDGWDDLASLLPLVLSRSRQPYVEIALLTAFLLFVLMACRAAARATVQGYRVDYPEALDAVLEQQERVIESLLRLPEGAAADAAALEAAIASLRGLRGQPRQTRAFLAHARNLLGEAAGQRPPGRSSDTAAVEIRHQIRLLQRLQDAAAQADRKRKSALLSNAMMLMLAGMLVSICKAVTGAILKAAEDAARDWQVERLTPVVEKLQMAVPIIMATAQLLQASSGALGLRTHRLHYRQLQADLAAARQAFGPSPHEALALYLQDQALRRRTAGFGQLWSGSLCLGQLLMLVANILFFLRPAGVLPLAIPGAILTLLSSVLIGTNEAREEGFVGAEAPRHLQTLIRNPGLQLHEHGLDATWLAGTADYLRQQEWVVQSHLWDAMLAMLETKEDILAPWPRCLAQERRQDIPRHIGRAQRRHLLPAGVERIADLLRQRYPVDFFDRPVRAIHEAIAAQMQDHPDAAAIQRHFDFRQEVFAATMAILARRPEAARSPLMQRVAAMPGDRLRADPDLLAQLASDPVAHAIHLQVGNRRLAGHLVRSSLARRDCRHETLSRLAHTTDGQPAGGHGLPRATSAHEAAESSV